MVASGVSKVKNAIAYIWYAIDLDSKELLAIEDSYGRSSLNALKTTQQ